MGVGVGVGAGVVGARAVAMACSCAALRLESDDMAPTEEMPLWIRATLAPALLELASGP